MIIVVGALLGARSITPRAQVTLERVTQGRRYETQLRRIAAALAPLVRDPVWSRFVTLVVWTMAALNILGLLDPAMAMLDKAAVTLGCLRISALAVVKEMLSLAVLLSLATLASRLLERRITSLPNLTPSLQVPIVKLLKMALVQFN